MDNILYIIKMDGQLDGSINLGDSRRIRYENSTTYAKYSIKRFETTGQISLLSLTKIATALGVADELRELFTQVPYRDIQEVINERK